MEQSAHYIVLVDDDPSIRQLYAEELREVGYEILAIEDGRSLLSAMEDRLPDLIILDIILDGKGSSGLDLLVEIRQEYADVPIVICSAYDTFKVNARTIAADYFVVKSFETSGLLETIRRALEAHIPQ